MTSASDPSESRPPGSPVFLTTRWSVVMAARDEVSPDAAEALESLCQTYWYPLYAFVRRQGKNAHDAEDLTQAFFAKLLEKNYLRAADRGKGRFRTFLLVALKRFLANEWDRTRAKKRGGGQAAVPMDTAFAESRFAADPASDLPDERDYDHRWARTLLDRAMGELRAEYETSGKAGEFEILKAYLTAERGEIPYHDIAATLKISEAGSRSAVHRLRKRFRLLFRQLIADTVSDPAEVDDEVRHVVAALSRE